MILHFDNPTTAVSLQDFDRAGLGATLNTQFGPETAMLINNTDRTIVAARFIWTGGHNPRTGRPTKHVVQTDIFSGLSTKPIMVGHSRTIIGPGTILSVSDQRYQGKGITSGFFGFSQPGEFSGDTTVSVDAVMFDDGEVVGPDTGHLADDMVALKTAIAMLRAKVRSSGATRQTLEGMLSTPTPTSDQELRLARALRHLVQQALALVPESGYGPRLPPGKRLAPQSVEQWLLALPQPPTPFREEQR